MAGTGRKVPLSKKTIGTRPPGVMKVWKHLYRCCWNTLLRADWCADSRRRLPQSLKHWVARKHKRSPPESLPTSSPSRANAHHKPIKKKKELNAVNPWTCSPCRSVNKITVRVITSFYAACVSCRAEADNSSVMTHILSQSRCCILPSSPRFLPAALSTSLQLFWRWEGVLLYLCAL